MINLIPIGVRCRTAEQCRRYSLFAFKRKIPSYPFDWTITPFKSLMVVSDKIFDPTLVLDSRQLLVNSFGSITDIYSGICFHHDLPQSLLLNCGITQTDHRLMPGIIPQERLESAKARFIHTFSNLNNALLKADPIVWVRWRNLFPIDNNVYDYHYGESSSALLKIVKRFNRDQCNSFLLIVETIAYQASSVHAIDSPIMSIERFGEKALIVKIKERLGDGLSDFHYVGDTDACRKMFAYCLPRLTGQPKSVLSN